MYTKSKEKKPRLIKLVILVITFSIIASCNNRSNNGKDFPKYTGEELFKGIMFAEGKVADLFQETVNIKEFVSKLPLNQKQRDAFKIIQDSIISKIKQVDKNYFLNFQNNVESGNHILIDSTLKTATNYVKYFLTKDNSTLSFLTSPNSNVKNVFSENLKQNNFKSLKAKFNVDSLSTLDTNQVKKLIEDYKKNIGSSFGQNLSVSFASSFDNTNLNTDKSNFEAVDKNLNITKSINNNIDASLMKSFDINLNLQQQFGKLNVNKGLNSGREFWIETDIAAYVEIAVVAIVAAVVVVRESPDFTVEHNLFNEKLVNSIAVKFKK